MSHVTAASTAYTTCSNVSLFDRPSHCMEGGASPNELLLSLKLHTSRYYRMCITHHTSHITHHTSRITLQPPSHLPQLGSTSVSDPNTLGALPLCASASGSGDAFSSNELSPPLFPAHMIGASSPR